MMDTAARIVIVAGLVLTVAGVLLWAAARTGLGRLPGDFIIGDGSFRIIFPLTASLLLSIAATILLNVAVRLWR
jgi:hypothetical protein